MGSTTPSWRGSERAGAGPTRDAYRLPEAFQALKPWEAEDVLCIFKDTFARLDPASFQYMPGNIDRAVTSRKATVTCRYFRASTRRRS